MTTETAKTHHDVHENIATTLAIDSMRQQGDLILTRVQEKYANQISGLTARANAVDTSAREVEKLFFAMMETVFTNRQETFLKLTTMHDNGILSDDDLRHAVATWDEYYQKRRLCLEAALWGCNPKTAESLTFCIC